MSPGITRDHMTIAGPVFLTSSKKSDQMPHNLQAPNGSLYFCSSLGENWYLEETGAYASIGLGILEILSSSCKQGGGELLARLESSPLSMYDGFRYYLSSQVGFSTWFSGYRPTGKC